MALAALALSISGKDSLVDSSSEANSLHLPRSSLLGKKNFLGV